MTEREKMIEAINSVQAYGIMSNAFGGDLPVTNEMLADALIAVGIGDISEWKHRADVAERPLHCLARSFAEAMCKDGNTHHLIDGFIRDAYRQAKKELAEENNNEHEL